MSCLLLQRRKLMGSERLNWRGIKNTFTVHHDFSSFGQCLIFNGWFQQTKFDMENLTSLNILDYFNENGTFASTENKKDWTAMGILLAICVTGVVGNLIVIFMILIMKDFKKSITHWYILQLAFADLLFVLTIPFKVQESYHNSWIHSEAFCKTNESILFINYYASAMFLTVIAVDRYIFMRHKRNKTLQKLRNRTSACVITSCVWCVSILLSIPVMLYSGKHGLHPTCKCTYEFPKPVTTIEEFCLEQGFVTDEEIDLCKSMAAPEPAENCINFSSDALVVNTTGVMDDYQALLDYFGDFYDYDIELLLQPTLNETNKDNITHEDVNYIDAECHYWHAGDGWSAFLIFNFICMFVVPVIIMSYCYVMIVRSQPGNKSSDDEQSIGDTKITNTDVIVQTREIGVTTKTIQFRLKTSWERRRVTLMCAALVLLFVICWLPFHVVHLAKINGIHFNQNGFKWCSALHRVSSIIAFSNSALNPYFYNFFGVLFKYRIKKAFKIVASKLTRR